MKPVGILFGILAIVLLVLTEMTDGQDYSAMLGIVCKDRDRTSKAAECAEKKNQDIRKAKEECVKKTGETDINDWKTAVNRMCDDEEFRKKVMECKDTFSDDQKKQQAMKDTMDCYMNAGRK